MVQPEVRTAHPYYMYDAVHQQPEAVASMLQRHGAQAREVAAQLAGKRRLFLVGIGTSWHAALTAEHWFRQLSGIHPEAQAWHSFEFVAYPPPGLGPDDAVLIISHRGTKTYSFEALDVARDRGALTIAISSTSPGPRLEPADIKFQTVEQEKSAAFTVSYTSALAVMAQIAIELGLMGGVAAANGARSELERVPSLMQGVLDRQQEVAELVDRHQDHERYLFTGWGPNEAQALEVSLKIKETSFSSTEGFQVEQLLHGPFIATPSNSLLTLIAPPGPGYRRSVEITHAAAEIGAPVWALVQEGDEELGALVAEAMTLPAVDELWSPFVYVLPLQLLTYYLALAKDCQPDRFRRDDPAFAAAHSHYVL